MLCGLYGAGAVSRWKQMPVGQLFRRLLGGLGRTGDCDIDTVFLTRPVKCRRGRWDGCGPVGSTALWRTV